METMSGNGLVTKTDLLRESGAIFDVAEKYRYLLWRNFTPTPKSRVLFVMLNPSTADHSDSDPTMTKCVGFAKRWEFESMQIVNLFALRSTDPRALRKRPLDEIVGPHNDVMIHKAANDSDRIVVAWGANARLLGPLRAEHVIEMLLGCRPKIWSVRLTSKGDPEHPLYVPYEAEPVVYRKNRASEEA